MKRGLNLFGFSKFQNNSRVCQTRCKKGISPLIATVLILGFTVALAAVIMVWGQKFTTGIQKQTEGTASTQMRCAKEVDFTIKDACMQPTGRVQVTIENNQALTIDRLALRFYASADNVQTRDMFTGGIPAYGISTDVFGPSPPMPSVKLVEALPVVTFDGKQITCAANKQDFGDLYGADIPACP